MSLPSKNLERLEQQQENKEVKPVEEVRNPPTKEPADKESERMISDEELIAKQPVIIEKFTPVRKQLHTEH